MNILLTDSVDNPVMDPGSMIYQIQKHGADNAYVVEMPSPDGIESMNRSLVFVFRKPDTIADITVIAIGNCSRDSASLSSYFYRGVKANVDSDQWLDTTDLRPDYIESLANKIFGHPERPMFERKDLLETFLLEYGLLNRFPLESPKDFGPNLKLFK